MTLKILNEGSTCNTWPNSCSSNLDFQVTYFVKFTHNKRFSVSSISYSISRFMCEKSGRDIMAKKIENSLSFDPSYLYQNPWAPCVTVKGRCVLRGDPINDQGNCLVAALAGSKSSCKIAFLKK